MTVLFYAFGKLDGGKDFPAFKRNRVGDAQ